MSTSVNGRISRRAFVAMASSLCLMGPRMVAEAAGLRTRIPVGVQLWTLRRELADDMPGTLRQVSKIGYEGVELWFQKWPDPRELKNVLDDCGLKIASAHVNLKDMLEDFPRLRDYHRAIGNTTLVIPYIPDFAKLTPEGWRKTVDDVRLAARAGREEGFTMLYHNHDFEFKPLADGTVIEDLLLEKCNPEWVNFQMDLYWVTKANANALTYFEKYPGRFKAWHVKDMDKEGKFAPVGTGTIDFKSILAQKEKSGMEFYLVEQDQTFGLDPMEAIKISHKGLIDLGFK